MAKQNSKTNPLRDWHEILGHCNYFKDVLALEGVVDGMKVVDKREFDCDVCVMGKMTQFRNREPDRCASIMILQAPFSLQPKMVFDMPFHSLMIFQVLL